MFSLKLSGLWEKVIKSDKRLKKRGLVTHPNKDQCLGVPDLVFPLPDFDDGKLNRASTSTCQPFHLEKEIKIINDVSLVYISLQKQAALFFFTVRVSFTKLNKWASKLDHVQIKILNKRTEGSDKKWRNHLSLTLKMFSILVYKK